MAPGSTDQRVIVVGAGIAGLASAWHLADRAEVVLVDQGPGPASEATGHGVGMVRRLTEDPVERVLALRTAEWLRSVDAPGVAAIGSVIALAHEPTAANDMVAALRARGVRVEAGFVPPVLRDSPVRTTWWAPDELVVDPRALAAWMLRRVADVRFGVRVTGLRRDGDRIVGVDTDHGPIEGRVVVLATGAWSARLAASVGLERPLVPLRRTVLRLAAPAPPDHPWVWIDDEGLYLRPDGDGWLVSPCDEAVDFPDAPGTRRAPTEAAVALTREKLRRWVPALAEAPQVGGWSGLRTFAPDRRPVLGPDPDRPGLWWVTGLGGYGITGGYAAAEAVITWLLGGTVPWLRPELVAPGRRLLARWPIRPTGEARRSLLIDTRTDPRTPP